MSLGTVITTSFLAFAIFMLIVSNVEQNRRIDALEQLAGKAAYHTGQMQPVIVSCGPDGALCTTMVPVFK